MLESQSRHVVPLARAQLTHTIRRRRIPPDAQLKTTGLTAYGARLRRNRIAPCVGAEVSGLLSYASMMGRLSSFTVGRPAAAKGSAKYGEWPVKVESDGVVFTLFHPAAGIATEKAGMSSDGSERGLIMVVEDEPAIADVMRLNLAKGRLRRTRRTGWDVRAGRDPSPQARRCDLGHRPSRAGRDRGVSTAAIRERLDSGAVRDRPRRRGRSDCRARTGCR